MKKILIYILSMSMGLVSPAWAQTATSPYKSDDMRRFVKAAGLNKKTTTIEQVFNVVKPGLTPSEALNWELALGPYMKNKIPNIRVNWLDGKNGEALNPKIYVNDSGESFVFELSDNPDVMYRFNGKNITVEDMKSDGGRAKIVSAMPAHKMIGTHVGLKYKGKLLPAEWLRISKPKIISRYFKELRALNLAVERVGNFKRIKKSAQMKSSIQEFALSCLFPEAFAGRNDNPRGDVGSPCTFAGWTGSYVDNGRVTCDLKNAPNYTSYKNCSSNQYACNPAIFGHNSGGKATYGSGGDAFCASKGSSGRYNDATMQCHTASPIEELVKHMQTKNKGNQEAAKADVEAYNELLRSKMAVCKQEPANTYEDQDEACEALNTRLLAFEEVKDDIIAGCLPGAEVPQDDLLPPPAPAKVGNQSGIHKWIPLMLFGAFAAIALLRGKNKDKEKEPTPKPDPKPPTQPQPPKPPEKPPVPPTPVDPPTIPKVDRLEVPTTPTGTRPQPFDPNFLRDSVN